MGRKDHGQTAPGERAASSPVGRLCSAPLARLAPTKPSARLPASASSAPLGPDGANFQETLCCFLSDNLSGRAGALSLIMGRAAGSQCSNGSGRADQAYPFRDSRPSGNLPGSPHSLRVWNHTGNSFLTRETFFSMSDWVFLGILFKWYCPQAGHAV